jgi:hypothetical protein
MKIQKIAVMRAEDGRLSLTDAIEHEGALWLVTRWIAGRLPSTESPEKIVSLRGLPIQKAPGDMNPPADWILNIALSKAAREGQTGQGHEVVEKPDMTRLIRSTEVPETKH